MALTRILGLSKSPSLHHHCRRTFSTAFNHARLVYPITVNRDSKACSSKRLIGPFFRNFCTSPVVSDDMQRSVTEDLIYSVKSLRTDVESLQREVSLLSAVVRTIQKNDPRGSEEKTAAKMSDFSEAMATHFNTNIVISQDEKVTEKMSDLSEAMGTHDFNKEAVEKMSYFSGEDEKLAEENNKATEETMAMDLATHDTEIQKSDTEEETVPDGKEQDPLLKEIESEISRAENFSLVSRQGRIFPDDFPFRVYDSEELDSIALYQKTTKLEYIQITVKPPSVFTCITAENYQHHKSSNFIMHLCVQIQPHKGGDISIDCSAYSTGFHIDKVSIYPYREGLDFCELDDKLRTEFKKYLERRGITTSTTNIIFGYMLDKANRAKLRCLYNFLELVEA